MAPCSPGTARVCPLPVAPNSHHNCNPRLVGALTIEAPPEAAPVPHFTAGVSHACWAISGGRMRTAATQSAAHLQRRDRGGQHNHDRLPRSQDPQPVDHREDRGPQRRARATRRPRGTTVARARSAGTRMKRTHPRRSWRAGCGESRTSGSEGGDEETTGRQGRHGASPPTLRERRSKRCARTAPLRSSDRSLARAPARRGMKMGSEADARGPAG